MQWWQAGETRFATPVSRISGLPHAGILRFTARLGISLRTGLPYAGIWPAAWLRISARTGLPRAGIWPTAWLGISVRTGLPRAGIWPTAWLGISVRTGLLRPLEPAIRAGQRLIAPSPECPRPAPQHRRDRLARIHPSVSSPHSEAELFPRMCGAGQAVRSAETGVTR